MSEFDKDSSRAKSGLGFEKHATAEILSRIKEDYTLSSVEEVLRELSGTSTISYGGFKKFVPSLDMSFGDRQLRLNGKFVARISMKSSKDGTTITATDDHLETFCSHFGPAYFIFAVVDENGNATGTPYMLPATKFKLLYDQHKIYDPQESREKKKYFAGMQSFIFDHEALCGWNAIVEELSKI